jgi:RimJ/RimL family protein N-acetyltransferase
VTVALRPLVPGDAEALYAIESLPAMVEYQSFEARTRESATTYVTEAIAAATAVPRTWYEYAITVPGHAAIVGRVGGSVTDGEAWVWYAVAPWVQGRGIGRAALAALLALLPAGTTVRLECDPGNVGSCRVAAACGFVVESEGEIEIGGVLLPSRVYRLP